MKQAFKLYSQQSERSEKIFKEIRTYYMRAKKLLWYKQKEMNKYQKCDIYSLMKVFFKYYELLLLFIKKELF